MISYNLLHNDFVFNDQTSSTAMGKKYASSFASIFMANMEEEVLSKVICKPLVMFRFIDDIFFNWTLSKDELTEFINIFNSHEELMRSLSK